MEAIKYAASILLALLRTLIQNGVASMKILRWFGLTILALITSLAGVWAFGALYYDGPRLRGGLESPKMNLYGKSNSP
jgi:hypothetical protein